MPHDLRLVPYGTWLRAAAVVWALIALPACQDSGLRDGDVINSVDVGFVPTDDCPPPDVDAFGIVINEIMLVNVSSIADETGEFAPWIELFNPSSETVALGGAGLSDDLADPEKWTFPCTEEAQLAPGESLIIFFDGETDPETGGFATLDSASGACNLRVFHAGFVFVPGGTKRFILNGGSDLVTIDTDLLTEDVTFGRFPDGGSAFLELTTATPSCPNAPSSEPIEIEFVRGDVNQDGIVDAADVGELWTYVFDESLLPDCQDPLDVNDDGVINLSDVNFLTRAIDGAGLSIPGPYPNPGFDLTEDDLTCNLVIMPVPGDDAEGDRP